MTIRDVFLAHQSERDTKRWIGAMQRDTGLGKKQLANALVREGLARVEDIPDDAPEAPRRESIRLSSSSAPTRSRSKKEIEALKVLLGSGFAASGLLRRILEEEKRSRAPTKPRVPKRGRAPAKPRAPKKASKKTRTAAKKAPRRRAKR